MAPEVFPKVLAIIAPFVFALILFIRHVEYKDAYNKKVWELGESGYGWERSTQPDSKRQSTPNAKTKSKTDPVLKAASAKTSAAESEKNPIPKPAESKIISCPHCGAKCRVPAGNDKIRLTCPNPACGRQYEIDT